MWKRSSSPTGTGRSMKSGSPCSGVLVTIGRESRRPLPRRSRRPSSPTLNTTGHTLEWLLLSLPDEQVNDPRVAQATQFLTALMWNYRHQAWYIGAKGHALHALTLYDERVFGGKPGQRSAELAQFAEQVAAEGRSERTEQHAVPPTAGRQRARRTD